VIKKDQYQEWEVVLMLWEKVPSAEVRREAQKTKHLYIPSLRGKAEA